MVLESQMRKLLSFKKISKKKTVLNWQVSQLENYVDKISFIGGYKYDLLNKKKDTIELHTK